MVRKGLSEEVTLESKTKKTRKIQSWKEMRVSVPRKKVQEGKCLKVGTGLAGTVGVFEEQKLDHCGCTRYGSAKGRGMCSGWHQLVDFGSDVATNKRTISAEGKEGFSDSES